MDVIASNGSFGVGLLQRFEFKWHKDETLSARSKNGDVLTVTTGRGDFIEVLNKAGDVTQTGGDGEWLTIRVPKNAPVRLRFKELPDPRLSPEELQAQRKVVTRYLLSGMPYTAGIPSSLPEAIKWLQEKLVEIPEACRNSAQLDLDTQNSYGETYPNIEIRYSEPESDAEVVRRVQIERERARIAEEADKAKYEALKQKFQAA